MIVVNGRKLLLIIILLPIISSDLYSKVSVIIPCHSSHAYLLPELLENLEHQTRKPDEVVISISEATKRDFKRLKQSIPHSTFKVEILFSKKVKYAGENRNIAAKKVTGDLIITQDADDVPHPQRIEIIEYYFMKTKACHIMHQWYPSEQYSPFPGYVKPEWQDFYSDFDSIPTIKVKEFGELETYFYTLTNGCIGVSKKVLESLLWAKKKVGEDVQFNISVINKFHNTLVILAPLYIYRNELSCHKKGMPTVHPPRSWPSCTAIIF